MFPPPPFPVSSAPDWYDTAPKWNAPPPFSLHQELSFHLTDLNPPNNFHQNFNISPLTISSSHPPKLNFVNRVPPGGYFNNFISPISCTSLSLSQSLSYYVPLYYSQPNHVHQMRPVACVFNGFRPAASLSVASFLRIPTARPASRFHRCWSRR